MKLLLVIFVSICASLSDARWSSRIVGGEEASENQFPHQVALYRFGQFNCGGSIIRKNWVLTAAHCVDGGR